MITMLKSKIHRAIITESDLNYDGSITIDRRLMEAASLYEFEQVHVLDIDNGSRFVTYVIEGERDSGVICINGAAARLVHTGDRVIVLSYQTVPENFISLEIPIVTIGSSNRVFSRGHKEVVR